VLKKITEDTEEAGRTVRASEDDPQYLVQSEKSGGRRSTSPGRSREGLSAEAGPGAVTP
jgi:Hypervirulence associated proteins TUDOR domain